MAELELHCPSEEELLDAEESLEHILSLDDLGEIDLSPYSRALLAQLQEILLAAPISAKVASASESRS